MMLAGAGARQWRAAASARQKLATPLRSHRQLSTLISERSSAFVSRSTSRNSSVLSGYSLRSHVLRQPIGPLSSRFNSARFNSTSSTSQMAELQQAHAPTTNSAIESLNSISEKDLADVDISQIPEKLGYLKQLGIDFGFGPSSLVEYLLEAIHIPTGLPWVTSAIIAGALVRVMMFFISAGASDNAVKMQNIKHLTEPLRTRMRECQKEGNQPEMIKISQQLKIVHAEHGVNIWKSFYPFIQLPIGFGFFRVLRGMSTLPVPGLETETFLWLKDLTLTDPYFILPVATGILMHLSIRRGGEMGNQMGATVLRPILLYVLPGISTVFMFFWPGLMQVYFCSLALFSVFHSYLLTTPAIRRWLRISSLPAKDATPSEPPSRVRLIRPDEVRKEQFVEEEQAQQAQKVSFIDRSLDKVTGGFKDWKKQATDQITEFTTRNEKDHKRLNKNELKRATSYEARRREEEEYERQQRNERARENFQKRREQSKKKNGP